MSVAFVFPGQGSQAIGMMAGFDAHGIVRETFDEASAALGDDLWELVRAGPQSDLDQTVNTQPVMLTAGIAVWRAWRDAGGPAPAIMAGHSLGEYSALTAAGAIAFGDAVRLVRFRAETMQAAVPAGIGAMAAILGLADAAVSAACAEAAQGEVVEPVNFNAPSQVVIAGHRDAVERAVAGAKARGAKRAIMLAVSAPFHSSLLAPAAQRLAARLAEVVISAPAIPVLHNVDVETHAVPEAIRRALAQQADHPVRWVETIEALAARGVTHVVECGPGKVLSGLTRRIANGLQSFALTDSAAIDATRAALSAT